MTMLLNYPICISFKFEYELIQVQEVIFNEFFNFLHLKFHFALIIPHQIWTQEQGFSFKELSIINFILFNNQMSNFWSLYNLTFIRTNIRR